MKRSVNFKRVQFILIAALALTAQLEYPAFSASKSKKSTSNSITSPASNSNKPALDGVQTPVLDQSANLPVEPVPDSNVDSNANANLNPNERTFFPPPQLNDNYVAPNQMPAQIQNQNQTMPNLLQGGVESSATLQLQQPPPPVYNNNININRNMMPPPNYMQGQVMSFQNQMQRMQGQLAPLVQQQPLQGYQQYQQPTQFNLRIDRPNWIPPNAYTNDTMLAPYHNSNLFFWDKRGMPNRPQMVQLANSVTKYWHSFVPNPCFVLVEPLPAAPGNYVFTSQDRRAPRGWLQNTGQNSVSGFPMYRYWLDNPF